MACGGSGESTREGNLDGGGIDAGPPPGVDGGAIDARPVDAGAIDAGTITDGGGTDAASPDAPPPIDAPPPVQEGWTDLGQADDADASGQRVMGAGGLAFDASGAITIVWRQGDFASGSSQSKVWGNHYTPGVGWGTPRMLQPDAFDSYGELLIVGSADGSATAVWTERPGFPDPEGPGDLFASRWVPGTGWTAAVLLEHGAGDASMPAAWVDGAQRVNVVWRQATGTGYEIRTTRYEPGTGWAADAPMVGAGADQAGFSDVEIDAAGDILGIWVDHDAVTSTLRANRFTPGGGWGTPVVLDARGGANPRLAANANGDAIAVWYLHDEIGDAYSVWSDHFTAAGGWEGAAQLDHVDVTAWTPDVAIDPGGHAVAVWTQQTAVGQQPWASEYQPGSGWTAPVALDADGGYDPRVVIDEHGDAMAVWWDYGHETWARRLVAGAGWQAPYLLQQEGVFAGQGYPLPVGLPDGRVAVAMMRAANHLAVAVYQSP